MARQLNRATLDRQLLLRREPLDVVEGVRRVVALQAQEPPSPYLALWSRLDGFDPAELDRAFADHRIVKASLMRITLHAVVAADYPALHEAMQPTLRASRLGDPRFVVAGMPVAETEALIPHILEYTARPRTNAEVEAWLDERLGVLPKPGVWWALRRFAPLVHAPNGSPWSFGLRPSYLAAPHQERPGDAEASLRYLVRRYLEGFGPASVQDIAQFARVQRSRVRAAVDALGDALVRVAGPGGVGLLDVPGVPVPPDDTPAPPRLLPMWDSALLAYHDRSRLIPPAYRRLVIRNNGDVLPALLVDGYVAGVWRPLDGGIEASAFHGLPGDAWDGLEAEARALGVLLEGRDRTVYRRFARWWNGLPSAEVRMLGTDSPR